MIPIGDYYHSRNNYAFVKTDLDPHIDLLPIITLNGISLKKDFCDFFITVNPILQECLCLLESLKYNCQVEVDHRMRTV